jgi:predicted secreted protein
MANRLGQDEKIFVDNGSGVFNEIQGQTSYSINRSTNFINQSSKTTGTYDQEAPGRQKLQLSVQGIKIVPDANGLERVLALSISKAAAVYQIRVTPFTGSDVRFSCSMFTGGISEDSPDQNNQTWKVDLSNASLTGPTIDLLDA